MAKNITATVGGSTLAGSNVKAVVSNLGNDIRNVVYNGVEYWRKELQLPNLNAPQVNIRDPGIGVWGGSVVSDYFTITDYSKITCTIGVTAHAYRTSSWGISGTAHLYLQGATTITLGEVSQSQYYGGETSNTKSISYSIPSNLSGNYRLVLQGSGFRENTDQAATGYANFWASNILLE